MPLDQAANETDGLSFKLRAHESRVKMTCASGTLFANAQATWAIVPPWPNGRGVGPLIRRLRLRIPQGMLDFEMPPKKGSDEYTDDVL